MTEHVKKIQLKDENLVMKCPCYCVSGNL